MLLFLFFFFFSSRRRHTRYIGDWSSDVCSSDLSRDNCTRAISDRSPRRYCRSGKMPPAVLEKLRTAPKPHPARSEERRVGKECRCRWTTSHEKKKMKTHVQGSERR